MIGGIAMDLDKSAVEQANQAEEREMSGEPTMPVAEGSIGLDDGELEKVAGGFIRIIPGD